MSRVWPSITSSARMSELRARSTASRASMRSLEGTEKSDVLGAMPQHPHSNRPHTSTLDTVYSADPSALPEVHSGKNV